ncbi:MAG: arylsulfatase [Polaromonas sp.]|nr:arylsulfatase [Polaromonas sp.]
MTIAPRVTLIHAVRVAMQPVEQAFRTYWPSAQIVHLLDDSLSPDRAMHAELSPELHARINGLADYAVASGADAILYTCSAFGEAIEAAARRLSLPVLKPNESMFEAALQTGKRIGMLATFAPSVASMEEEFRALAKAHAINASITTIVVPEAMAALKAGDAPLHNKLLADAAFSLRGCDCLLLAHFSTSRAREAVQAVSVCPVLTSPDSAVKKLHSLMSIRAS